MKELQDIVNAFQAAQKSGRHCAIATVVHVDGSSYRGAGARMLITEDGQLTGAISGGCLEGDALRKARLVMVQQKPMLVTYDTTDEDDAQVGVQLGCNGIIQVLIEPVVPQQVSNPIDFFSRFLSKRDPLALITIFNMADRHGPQFGTCVLLGREGKIAGVLPEFIGEELLSEAIRMLNSDWSMQITKAYKTYGGVTCMVEILQPAVALVVVGAGNDALPLVRMAKVLGWHVTTVDGRINYNTNERFPTADRRIVSRPETVLEHIHPDHRTVFMLMTHNYNYDLELLTCLLPLSIPYIGVLGPKKRLTRMLAEIDSRTLSPVVSARHVYGPAGLDIGSENPEQIALSILAEIQAVLSNLSSHSLRDKAVIHDRSQQKLRHYEVSGGLED